MVKTNVILCGEGKGWHQERNHPIREAVLHTRGFPDGVVQEDGGNNLSAGKREMHCPISVKTFVLLHNRGRG